MKNKIWVQSHLKDRQNISFFWINAHFIRYLAEVLFYSYQDTIKMKDCFLIVRWRYTECTPICQMPWGELTLSGLEWGRFAYSMETVGPEVWRIYPPFSCFGGLSWRMETWRSEKSPLDLHKIWENEGRRHNPLKFSISMAEQSDPYALMVLRGPQTAHWPPYLQRSRWNELTLFGIRDGYYQ